MKLLAWRWIAPLTIAAAWLAFAVIQLPRYGPTFDAVLGDYAYGEVMYDALRAGDLDTLRDPAIRTSPDPAYYGEAGHPRWKRVYPLRWVYPVPAIVSAASCHLFARELGWLDPVDAHHLVAPIAAALLSILVYRFVLLRFDALTATAASLALLLHPRFVAHAMNNIKDAPTVLIVFAALTAFVRFLEHGRGRDIVLGMTLTGIGLATKINAIWPLGFFVIVYLTARARAAFRGEVAPLSVALCFLISPALIIGAWFACSPELWVDGFTRFAEHARYVLVESVRVEGRDFFTAEPVVNLLYVTPPLYLILFPIGLYQVVRRRALPMTVWTLLLVLLIVPIVRPCFPGMRYFNVIRHALEGIPVLAIFVGVGAAQIMTGVARWTTRRRAAQRDGVVGKGAGRDDVSPTPRGAVSGRGDKAVLVAGLLLAAPQVIANAAVHPWQTAYFNWIAGGLGKVQKAHRLDANDYWCHSYREGLRWINESAVPGAMVLAPVAPWMVGAVREVQLRPDLSFTENDDAVRALIGEGLIDDAGRDRERWQTVPAVYALFPPISKRYNLPPHSDVVHFCEDHRTPIHTIRCDGGVILEVYQILPAPDGE